MIVEFIGAPGSGKTTFMPYFKDYFIEKGYSANAFLDAARPFATRTGLGRIAAAVLPAKLQRFILWQIFYALSIIHRNEFTQHNQLLMDTVIPYQSNRPISEADKRHVLRWFIHLTGCYQFFCKRIEEREIVLFDEGFVHRVVQLFASETEEINYQAINEYLNLIPKPDLVIFVNASVNVCKERVFSRGVWDRFREKDPNETVLFLERAWKIVNYSVEKLREKNWDVVEIQNDNQAIINVQERIPQLVWERMEPVV